MVETPPGFLRRPAGLGRMARFAVTDPLAAAVERLGEATARDLARAAGLALDRNGELPGSTVAEADVAALHATLRREHPDAARAILQAAGTRSAEILIERVNLNDGAGAGRLDANAIDNIVVAVTGSVPTTFMRLANLNAVDVGASSTVST